VLHEEDGEKEVINGRAPRKHPDAYRSGLREEAHHVVEDGGDREGAWGSAGLNWSEADTEATGEQPVGQIRPSSPRTSG